MKNIPWRCEVCGIGLEEADRRRRKRGERGVSVRTTACSEECARERRARVYGEALRKARRQAPAPHRGRRGEWRCSECGIDADAARAKRRRIGLLDVLISTQLTCTPACKQARIGRLLAWGLAQRKRKAGAGRRAAAKRSRAAG